MEFLSVVVVVIVNLLESVRAVDYSDLGTQSWPMDEKRHAIFESCFCTVESVLSYVKLVFVGRQKMRGPILSDISF